MFRVVEGVRSVGERGMEDVAMRPSERGCGSLVSERLARAVRMRGGRLVWTGTHYVRPPLLYVKGMSYVIQLAVQGVRNRLEVTEFLSEVGRIYEVYCAAEGVACPEFVLSGPNFVLVQGQDSDGSVEGENEEGEE